MDRRTEPSPLSTQVSFETTRLSAQCLIETYEQLVPITRRYLQTLRRPPPDQNRIADEPIRRRADHA
jgi:hypothetical protein